MRFSDGGGAVGAACCPGSVTARHTDIHDVIATGSLSALTSVALLFLL